MKRYFLIVFLGFVLFSGCNIINPPEQVPTYIHIDSFKFVNTNPAYYGSSSHAINTVFAVYNGINIGVFDLPCTIPVLATGTNQLILSPGIAVNGFNDQEAPYPFYTAAIDTFTAQPGKIINYTPVTGYIGNTAMSFIDSFEAQSGQEFANVNGQVNFVTVNTPASSVFEGKGSGLLNFTGTDSSQVFTLQGVNIPFYTPVFCEFNYKSNVPIAIGLVPVSGDYTTDPQYNNIAFAPAGDWQKVYLSLAEIVSVFPSSPYYLVVKAAVPYGQKNGYALFDNIKVVTQQQ